MTEALVKEPRERLMRGGLRSQKRGREDRSEILEGAGRIRVRSCRNSCISALM